MKTSCWVLGMVAAMLVLTGCPEKRRPAGSPAMQKPATPAPVKTPDGEKKSQAVGPLSEYGKNLSNAEKTAAQTTGLVTLSGAIKQFEVIEGRFPRNLDELIAGRYLGKLPNPPRGKRFVYDARDGKVDVEALPNAEPEAVPTPPPAAPAPVVEPPAPPAPVIEQPVAPAPEATTPLAP